MIGFIIGLFVLIIGYALSWGITIGLLYLVCLCFSWQFDLLIATGIWLVLCLVKLIFPSKKGETKNDR